MSNPVSPYAAFRPIVDLSAKNRVGMCRLSVCVEERQKKPTGVNLHVVQPLIKNKKNNEELPYQMNSSWLVQHGETSSRSEKTRAVTEF